MFLDTHGLFCILHHVERHHAQAVAHYLSAASVRFTHSLVIAELVALCQARGVSRLELLSYIQDLLLNPDVETVWVDKQLQLDALNLLHSRFDKTYSLCDAVSFVLMRRRGINEALTNDRHFEQEGFMRLLV